MLCSFLVPCSDISSCFCMHMLPVHVGDAWICVHACHICYLQAVWASCHSKHCSAVDLTTNVRISHTLTSTLILSSKAHGEQSCSFPEWWEMKTKNNVLTWNVFKQINISSNGFQCFGYQKSKSSLSEELQLELSATHPLFFTSPIPTDYLLSVGPFSCWPGNLKYPLYFNLNVRLSNSL